MIEFLIQFGLFWITLVVEFLTLILLKILNSTNEDNTLAGFEYMFMNTLLISLLIGKLVL